MEYGGERMSLKSIWDFCTSETAIINLAVGVPMALGMLHEHGLI